jgi:hypothetical protein
MSALSFQRSNNQTVRRVPCASTKSFPSAAFEVMSKRRKGYPSEQRVKRGSRVVHGGKEFIRKAGPQRPVPVRVRAAIQEVLSEIGTPRWFRSSSLRKMKMSSGSCAARPADEFRCVPMVMDVGAHRHRGLGECLAPAGRGSNHTGARQLCCSRVPAQDANHNHHGNVAQPVRASSSQLLVGGSTPPIATTS